MAEYIKREELIKRLWVTPILKYGIPTYTRDGVIDLVEKQPAADVVEVPCRCKDCKHWMDFPNCGCTDFVKVCALAEYMIGANGYCLYGERKENNHD